MDRSALLQYPVQSAFSEKIQAAHCYQGKTNDCGPYSAAMVVNGLLSSQIDPIALARALDHPRWKGIIPVIRRIPQWATFPWGLSDALRQYGFPARWHPFGKPEDLIQLLIQRQIVLIIVGSWKPLWGHVMVLLAYDPERGWGFADPGSTENSLHWIGVAEFIRSWNAFGRLYVNSPCPVEVLGSGITSQ